MASESNSAVTVVRLSSRSEKPSNGINSLTGTASMRTGTREDSGRSSSESEDSDKEMTSASFEGDAASKI